MYFGHVLRIDNDEIESKYRNVDMLFKYGIRRADISDVHQPYSIFNTKFLITIAVPAEISIEYFAIVTGKVVT